jgi:hypothetical protein
MPREDSPLEPYDFSAVLALTPSERLEFAIEALADEIAESGHEDDCSEPPIAPAGGSDQELDDLESNLGISLPDEYRLFLSRWRYIDTGGGFAIGGLPMNGVHVGPLVWVSDEHVPGRRYLVFGDYSQYADGDQLMFDLDAPGTPVMLYLHEHGPRVEPFAPSFSLAICRALGVQPI